jgi:LPXTG-motif cell wall-anchored protein
LRKVLLLAALAMVATLVFAPAALTQTDLDCGDLSEAEEAAVFAADPSDPNGLDENENGVPCEDDTTDNGSYEAPTDDSTPTPEPTTVEPTTVEPTTVEPTTTTPTAGADDAQYKTASPTITALPETGGSVSMAAAMIPLALLVGGGLLAFGIVRRG